MKSRFKSLVQKQHEDIKPTPIKHTAFVSQLIAMTNVLDNVKIFEQLVPGGASALPANTANTPVQYPSAAAASMSAPVTKPEVPEEPVDPKTDSKPYTWLAYVAYRCLLMDPSELNDNDIFNELQGDIGDVDDRSDIKTPEEGLKILIKLDKLLDSQSTPAPADV